MIKSQTYTHLDLEEEVVRIEEDQMFRFAEGHLPFRGKLVLYALAIRPDEDQEQAVESYRARLPFFLSSAQKVRSSPPQDPSQNESARQMLVAQKFTDDYLSKELQRKDRLLPALRHILVRRYGENAMILVPGYVESMGVITGAKAVQKMRTEVSPIAPPDQTFVKYWIRQRGYKGKITFWE